MSSDLLYQIYIQRRPDARIGILITEGMGLKPRSRMISWKRARQYSWSTEYVWCGYGPVRKNMGQRTHLDTLQNEVAYTNSRPRPGGPFQKSLQLPVSDDVRLTFDLEQLVNQHRVAGSECKFTHLNTDGKIGHPKHSIPCANTPEKFSCMSWPGTQPNTLDTMWPRFLGIPILGRAGYVLRLIASGVPTVMIMC